MVRFVTTLLVAYLQVIFRHLLDANNQGLDESSLMMCSPLFVGVNLVLYVLYVVDSTFDVRNRRFVVLNSHTMV